MPYTSDQIKLFGIALAMKRGETPYSYSAQAAKIARANSEAEIKAMIAEGVKPKARRVR